MRTEDGHRPLDFIEPQELVDLPGQRTPPVLDEPLEAIGVIRSVRELDKLRLQQFPWELSRILFRGVGADYFVRLGPDEGQVGDTLLAQSAIDRLIQGAHTLVIEGPSWRQRGAPTRRGAIDETRRPAMLTNTHRWSHTRGNTVVPYCWQATLPEWSRGILRQPRIIKV